MLTLITRPARINYQHPTPVILYSIEFKRDFTRNKAHQEGE